MMKTIELQKQKIYCGNLMLVNAKYPLKTDDVSNLIPADMRFPDILMKRDAANVLQLIIEKLSAEKSIIPVSGYRTLREQTDIYFTYNKTISKGVVLLILLSSKIGYTAGVATCGIIRSSTVDLYLYSYSKTVLR